MCTKDPTNEQLAQRQRNLQRVCTALEKMGILKTPVEEVTDAPPSCPHCTGLLTPGTCVFCRQVRR